MGSCFSRTPALSSEGMPVWVGHQILAAHEARSLGKDSRDPRIEFQRLEVQYRMHPGMRKLVIPLFRKRYSRGM